MKTIRIELLATDICEFTEGDSFVFLRETDHVACDAGDELIVSHGDCQLFSGEITSWSMGSDMDIHAASHDIIAEDKAAEAAEKKES